jgi:membrane-bound lytic murein transglycosylase B
VGLIALAAALTLATNAHAHNQTVSMTVVIDGEAFAKFVEGVWPDAKARGVARQTFDAAFADVKAIPRVIELDRHQPEFSLTFEQYLARVAPQSGSMKGANAWPKIANC